MSNLVDFAIRELDLAGFKEPKLDSGEPIDEMAVEMRINVIELIKVFSEQGHSGMSAPFCVFLFRELANYKPLTPLTGEDSEWIDVTEYNTIPGSKLFQNNRCFSVFKEVKADGEVRVYNTNGIVFKDKDGGEYGSQDSVVDVVFPYTPEIKYVNDYTDDEE